ncbi:hypothetical protein LTR85_010671 [Meristemomyces frigidus]|nr:hypothetical protein LTR85_010671 [Meristemomyces frigidus]
MGYSEVLCHICGVSFNIGRIRRSDEPRSAAWAGSGGRDDSFVDGGRNSHIGECHRDSGCMFTIREVVDASIGYTLDKRGKRAASESVDLRWGEDPIGIPSWSDDDTEYVYESSDGEEPLEYMSDEEMADQELGTLHDAKRELHGSGVSDNEHESNADYRPFWHRVLVEDRVARSVLQRSCESFPAWHRVLPPGSDPSGANTETTSKPRDEMFPLFYPTEDDGASEHGSDGSYTPRQEVGTHQERHDRLRHHILGKLGYHADDEHYVEHIAGTRCVNNRGYNGHNISAEELRGCLTSQCLIRKPPLGAMLRYRSDADDEAFERNGSFFLSGLSDHMPSRDYDSPSVYPHRHGCDRPHAENNFWEEEKAEEYAMPFHPACLEVYKRASRLEVGESDIEGLTDWWTVEADYDSFHALQREVRDPNVRECARQEWKHYGGTEYLAANPLFVPTLPALLEQALSSDPSFDARSGAFNISEQPAVEPISEDAFAVLPHELRMLILAELPSKDVANLRLASRTFRQLPIDFFHDLLLREMPWLWELWCDVPYSPWACTTAAELERSDKRYASASQAVRDYVRIVKEEMPELTSQMDEAATACQENIDLEAHHSHASAASRPATLPRDRTNWFILYTLITRHMQRGELKGLQNRRRIWDDCEEILRRIGKYRAQGVFPVQDVRAVVREAQERRRDEARRDAANKAAALRA